MQQREWISESGAEAQVEAGSLRPHPPASVVWVFLRAELLAQKQPYFSLSWLSYLQTTFHSQSGIHNEGGGEWTSVSSLKNIYKNMQGSPSTKSQGPENRVLSLNSQRGRDPRAASSSSGDILKNSSLNTCGNCNLIDLRWCWEFVFS